MKSVVTELKIVVSLSHFHCSTLLIGTHSGAYPNKYVLVQTRQLKCTRSGFCHSHSTFHLLHCFIFKRQLPQ